jgi:signal peptidase I
VKQQLLPNARVRLARAFLITLIVGVSVILGGLAAGHRPVVLLTGSMAPTAPPESLIIAAPRAADEVAVGDILVMRREGSSPVTHRVVEIERSGGKRFAITQGDANEVADAAPYPIDGEQLVARWIRPGFGGLVQSVFKPGIALAVMGVALSALVVQTLRTVWAPSTTARQTIPNASGPRRRTVRPGRRKRYALVFLPLTALLTTGVSWALFASSGVVAANDFTTAGCFDAQLGSVQSGETIHAVDGTVSVPISAVVPSSSFVLASVRSSANEPADSMVLAQLATGGTAVDLIRATDNPAPPLITVAWSVVEYSCGVSVQRGTLNGDGSAVLDIPVSVVDPAASFVLHSGSAPRAATAVDGSAYTIGTLSSPSSLRLHSGGAPLSTQQTFAWQVVSFDDPGDLLVQEVSGTLATGDEAIQLVVPSPVNSGSTFLLAGATTVGTGPNLAPLQIRAHLLEDGTVEIRRAASGVSVDVSVQVVTMRDGTSIRHGTVDFASAELVRTVGIDPVDPSRSSAFSTVTNPGVASGGLAAYSGDDVLGEGSATFVISGPEAVDVSRGSSNSDASFGWQVVEWAGPGWWDPSYDFRQRIDVETTSAAAPGQYTTPVTIDHAALVASGLSLSSGEDVRLLRWNGLSWTELDRILADGESWDQSNTTLLFQTTDSIEASSSSTYWLYFGNDAPPIAPADPEQVFLLYEDFESGTLGDFEDRTGGSNWYAADPWTRRIPLTVPAGSVSTSLSNFPILVSLTNIGLATDAQTDGSDLRFTAADGATRLAHEIESWDSVSGTLVAWVNVPAIASTSPTLLYLYYGAPNAPSQDDVRGTWSSDFETAWHLAGDPSGTAPQLDDSTTRNHDGLGSGGLTGANSVAGIVGQAVELDGVDDMLQTDPFQPSGAALTISGWVRLDSYANSPRLVSKATTDSTRIVELTIANGGSLDGLVSIGSTPQQLLSPPGVVTLGAWHHLAMTWDGAAIRLYVDGVEVATGPAIGLLDSDSTMPVTIGGIASVNHQLDGRIDEVRIERVTRNASWIAAAYANQLKPAVFVLDGAIESGTYFAQGAWTARKPISVNAAEISADLGNVPILVSVVDAELAVGAQVDGFDFVFTDSDGVTRLDHVIESWDRPSGSLSVWVEIPLISSTKDADLFLYYGNAVSVDQQDREAVFGASSDLVFLGGS